MDFKVEKKKSVISYFKKFGIPLVLVTGLYVVFGFSGGHSYTLNAKQLSFSPVKEGVFEESIPINGIVEPLKVVYLDAIQGGTVDEVLVSEGEFVKAGQPLLVFKNTAFQLEIFFQEARISEQLDINANTRLTLDQNELDLRTKLNDIDYSIKDLGRQLTLRRALYAKGHIAKDELDALNSKYEYNIRYQDIIRKTELKERDIRVTKIRQLKESEGRLQEHLKIIRASLDDMVVKAPISGLLSSLSLDVGESKSKGDRLGQIDQIDGFKIAASVDAFYISRMEVGKKATYKSVDKIIELKVTKIYPEVKNGTFLVDLAFEGESPNDIRRGQNIVLSLSLGAPKEALLVRNGAFYSDTGGAWVFVLSEDGKSAVKREVGLGKRNSEYVEVLRGLNVGEKVITSSYSNFKDKNVINIKSS